MSQNMFSKLPDDVVLTIFFKLEEDPRNWAKLACVSTKFSSIIINSCLKPKCSQKMPTIVSDLISNTDKDWATLHKLAVCCPGLHHAGVLLENSDFGLERDLGPDEDYIERKSNQLDQSKTLPPCSSMNVATIDQVQGSDLPFSSQSDVDSDCAWSLFDDLYFDTMYNATESEDQFETFENLLMEGVFKKRKICTSLNLKSHLASNVWNLSREQGNKLLASRFRGDCLYICDWPGCVHVEEKRNYMLFRGIFKNFKRSSVWRTIKDGDRSKIDLNCGYCSCKQIWDLHSAFCLKRIFGYHDDGEPVVRAYVCENGHVSGAWTDWPLYS